MENKIADLRLGLKEIRSCIYILQKAIENENEEIFLFDISNYLEVALNKLDKIIENFSE